MKDKLCYHLRIRNYELFQTNADVLSNIQYIYFLTAVFSWTFWDFLKVKVNLFKTLQIIIIIKKCVFKIKKSLYLKEYKCYSYTNVYTHVQSSWNLLLELQDISNFFWYRIIAFILTFISFVVGPLIAFLTESSLDET